MLYIIIMIRVKKCELYNVRTKNWHGHIRPNQGNK